MALKKFNEAPYLQEGEKTVHKVHVKKSKSLITEMIACYILWIASLSGSCFVISAGIGMKQYETLKSGYILIVICLLFVNLVPFIFWLFNIIKNMYKRSERWYVLTDKRLLTITENKPAIVTVINLNDVTEVSAGKKSITLIMSETRYTITQIDDVTAFLNRLEILVFGEQEEENEMFEQLGESNESTGESTEQGEPEVWIE